MMTALTIVTALMGADAGALGAARHAWRNTGAPDSV
jgi:hypothetical protein